MQLLLLVSKVISFQNVNNSNNVTGGGVDYDSGPYNITFPAGVTSVPFGVPINNDNILESNEQFQLHIVPKSLPDRVIVSNPSQAIVSITDNDGKSSILVMI